MLYIKKPILKKVQNAPYFEIYKKAYIKIKCGIKYIKTLKRIENRKDE